MLKLLYYLTAKDKIVEELQSALSDYLPKFELSLIEHDSSMHYESSILENISEILRLCIHNKWNLNLIKTKFGMTIT